MSENLLAVLWRGRWTVIAIVLLAALAAALGSQWLEKRYTTTSSVLIQPRDSTSFDAVQAAQVTARTYSEALSGASFARVVSERLGGNPSPGTVAADVELAPVPETELVEIRAEASDPERAKALADTYADVFTESVERMLGPSDQLEVTVVDEAPINDSPSRPRTTLNVLIAVLLAMPLAAGAAVLRDRRDPRVASPDELETDFAVPVLARVPERGRSGRNLPAFKEAFRMLAARMPFGDDAGAVRVIAITSVSDGEGRTTVAWELALAAVEAGRQVVVVDLERGDEDDDDDEDPSRRGFWDYVAGSAELDDVIATSPLDNLHFVPAGAVPDAAALQLFDGERGRVVAEALGRAADVVIFDAPTAGDYPITVARLADATLLVVDLTKSTRQQIDGIVRRLRTDGAYILGCVVNRVAAVNFAAYRRRRGFQRTTTW